MVAGRVGCQQFAARMLRSHVLALVAATVDASADGLAIRGAWTWAPGSRVTIRLTTPRGSAVARALVQRADDDVMGLSLLVLGPRFARLLESSTLPS